MRSQESRVLPNYVVVVDDDPPRYVPREEVPAGLQLFFLQSRRGEDVYVAHNYKTALSKISDRTWCHKEIELALESFHTRSDVASKDEEEKTRARAASTAESWTLEEEDDLPWYLGDDD